MNSMEDKNRIFRKPINACVCNVKAAVRIYEEKNDPSDPAALAYICQAHACAKQVQLLAVIYSVREYEAFYAAFIALDTSFLRAAATKQGYQEIPDKYDLLMESFGKLDFDGR